MSTAFAVLLLVGCNQIFGLDPVTIVDAQIVEPPDATLSKIHLTLMIAKTIEGTSDPEPMPEYAPMPAVVVRAGSMTEPLAVMQYEAAVGDVLVPEPITKSPWRLEYTRPGSTTVEVQWSAREGAAHLVEPLFGRAERTPAPLNSTYTLTTTGVNAPLVFQNPHVITTGVLGVLLLPANDLPPVTAPMANLGHAAEAARGDRVVLADYQPASPQVGVNCLRMVGSALYVPTPLAAGADTPMSAIWDVGESSTVTLTQNTGAFGLAARTQTALDDGGAGTRSDSVETHAFVGLGNAGMPAFPTSFAGVPQPETQPWLDCKGAMASPLILPAFFSPDVFRNFPNVAYVSFRDKRTLGTTDLVSSIVAVVIEPEAAASSLTVDFRVPYAIAPIKLGTLDLTAAVEGAQVLASDTGQTELTFEIETDPTFVVHYYEVVLYRIDAGVLVTKRIFVLADPARRTVVIDNELLDPGTHVFAIRSYRGRPGTINGDFKAADGAQAVATVFTRTFVVM